MTKARIIARLDIKGPNLIKGVHLEGLRIMGDPNVFACRYYEDGVDELLYMDTVASLYGRNSLLEIIEHTAHNIFVPITVGGGIRSVDDATKILRAGADKVAINTEATKRPEIISEISHHFGSQCIVLGIEAKRNNAGGWSCLTDNGREATTLEVIEWAQKGEALGAGEILLTSVDNEGTRKGMDVDLIRAVSEAVTIPVIASGGFASVDDFETAIKDGGCSAVAIADAFHYDRITVNDLRQQAQARDISLRKVHD